MTYESHATGECSTAALGHLNFESENLDMTPAGLPMIGEPDIRVESTPHEIRDSVVHAHHPDLLKWVASYAKENRLSPQETRLLLLAVEGVDNEAASAMLCCSRPTIATYWNRIFKKTKVSCQRDVLGGMLRWIILRNGVNIRSVLSPAPSQRKAC